MKFLKIIFIIFIFSFSHQKSFSEINIDATYVIIQDHLSGEILFEKNADAKIYPASMTKIMTSIVAFDLLKKGETSLDELVTISDFIGNLFNITFVLLSVSAGHAFTARSRMSLLPERLSSIGRDVAQCMLHLLEFVTK